VKRNQETELGGITGRVNCGMIVVQLDYSHQARNQEPKPRISLTGAESAPAKHSHPPGTLVPVLCSGHATGVQLPMKKGSACATFVREREITIFYSPVN